MFNKPTSIIAALLTISGTALAAPASNAAQPRSQEVSPLIQLCVDLSFGTCVSVQIAPDTCINMTGGLGVWNDAISSIKIPVGFVCSFYQNFGCLALTQPVTDAVVLQGGNWASLVSLPGDGRTIDLADCISSFSCSPLV